MRKDVFLTVVLPTYNEARNVREILTRLFDTLDGFEHFEILFVDDSSDNTPHVIAAEARNDSRIKMIHRPTDRRDGLAGAFMEGFKHAKGNYICCMDSDLQHPPLIVPILLQKLIKEHADVAIASRYMKGGSAKGLGSSYRIFVSIASKWIAKLMLAPIPLGSDPGTGFFVFRKTLLDGVTLSPLGFKILIEILARTRPKKIVEIPFQFQPRTEEVSKATFAQGIAFIRHLLRIFFHVPEAGRLLKFCIVGATGVIVNLGILYSLVEYAHFSYTLAWIYAVLASIASNFYLNSIFTYSDRRSRGRAAAFAKFSQFLFSSLVALVVNYAIYRGLVTMGVWYVSSDLLGVIAGTGINFALAQSFVWKKVSRVTRREVSWVGRVVSSRVFLSSLFAASFLAIVTMFIIRSVDGVQLLDVFVPIISLFLAAQGIFALFLMLYAWEDPTRSKVDASPKTYLQPQYSFTALIPARHEEHVIADTIRAVARIDYPAHLKEVLVVCRSDDQGTIAKAQKVIHQLGGASAQLIIFDGFPINKPHGLNIGLRSATKDIVTIFDAEDEPHPDIYNIVNTVMVRDGADVVQSGVQLMNYRTRWFSLFNVVEYYFWFKSSLHFFARSGLIPLGGNTVFFKRKWVEHINGWDASCLTEDADIGFRLSLAGAKTRVIYDERHVTKEETPNTVASFVKQRTRWNQGFIQIFFKGDWLLLPKTRQRALALYILGWPFVQAITFLYIPLALWMTFTVKLPVLVVLLANLPLYILLLHFVTYLLGLYEFTRDYKLRFPVWYPLKTLLFFYPFQLLLGISAVRAVLRELRGLNTWEKTAHANLHRSSQLSPMMVSIGTP